MPRVREHRELAEVPDERSPLETPVPPAEGSAQSGAPGEYFRVLVTAVSVAEWATGGRQWPKLPWNTRKLRKSWIRPVALHMADLQGIRAVSPGVRYRFTRERSLVRNQPAWQVRSAD